MAGARRRRDIPLMNLERSTALMNAAAMEPESEAAESRIMQSAAIAQEAVPIGRRAGLEQREGAPGGRPVPGQAGRSRELPGPHPFALDITALKTAQGAAKEEEAAEGAEALPVWIGEKRSLSLQEE